MDREKLITQYADNSLLILCCLIVAGRCQMNESFSAGWNVFVPSGTVVSGPEIPTMLFFAATLWTLAIVWLLVHLWLHDFTWRKTHLAIPLALTLIASVLSCLAASNKQTAWVGALNWASPMVLALLLIQLLEAPWKRQLLLCVLIATGVTLAYRCVEQKSEVQTNLAFVMDNPEEALSRQGIQPDTHAAKQYFGRIKSGDIGGFLAISNTAASLLILTIMGTLGLGLAKLGQCRREDRTTIMVLGGILIVIQLWALWITQSKGGLGGFVCAVAIAAILWQFRRFFTLYWKQTLVIVFVLLALFCLAVAGHGLTQGRLPSMSLWVRWQYWSATAEMIAEHWLAGVGPQNFGTHYPFYMDPTAPEVVKDPHNFLLALWSQWGILGLVGFLWAVAAVSFHVARPSANKTLLGQPEAPGPSLWPLGLGLAVAIVAVRWLNAGVSGTTDLEQKSYLLVAFIVPGGVWFLSFCFAHSLTRFVVAPGKGDTSGTLLLFLTAGALGFLIHNSIDFAIFHPGVCTAFFASAALVVSLKNQNGAPAAHTVNLGARVSLSTLAVVLALAVWVAALFLTKSTVLLRQAQRPDQTKPTVADLEKSYFHLTNKQSDPACYAFAGKLAHTAWVLWYRDTPKLFDLALTATQQAQRLDPDNYRHARRLAELHFEAALVFPDDKEKHLTTAKEHIAEALTRYPSSAELGILSGNIWHESGQTAEALTQYQWALAQEQAFIAQQKEMFPRDDDHPGRLAPVQHSWLSDQIERLQQAQP